MAGRWMLRRPLDLAHTHPGEGYKDGTAARAVEGYLDAIRRESPSANLTDIYLPRYLVSVHLHEDDAYCCNDEGPHDSNKPLLSVNEIARLSRGFAKRWWMDSEK